jgi:hypothetical protein
MCIGSLPILRFYIKHIKVYKILMVCITPKELSGHLMCVRGGGIVESAILSYYNRYMHMHIVTTYKHMH